MFFRFSVVTLAIHVMLCLASIVHAQARIVGVAAHAFNDGREWAISDNGDYYRDESGTWTLLGNMLSGSGRSGERVIGLTATTYGGTYDYLWGMTDTGYLCSCYGSSCGCLGISNQNIFEVAGRPSEEVVDISTNGLARLYATTRNGGVFEIYVGDFSYRVTYLGNVFGTPVGVPSTPLAELVSIAPPEPNPWRVGSGSVRLLVSVPAQMPVDVAVFDPLGRRVASIYHGRLSPGAHVFSWTGALDDGIPAPAGLYVLKLSGSGVTRSQRLALVR